jgi:membrane-bound metal-dependent hydrolase YbcI (DUF457 family)
MYTCTEILSVLVLLLAIELHVIVRMYTIKDKTIKKPQILLPFVNQDKHPLNRKYSFPRVA